MQKTFRQLRHRLPSLAERASESIIHVVSHYLIPLGIGVVSLIALVLWSPQYAADSGVPLAVRAVFEDGAPLAPAAALSRLEHAAPVSGVDTGLSEAPLWFSFSTVRQANPGNVVEFPSRHASDIACWDQATLMPLGAASRRNAAAPLAAVKAGFALEPPALPAQVLCRAAFVGPARLTVLQWPRAAFDLSIEQYHRRSGLLDGGIIVLALFVLVTALINRRSLYVLFSAWLILNLRVGALSAGWDAQWLGQAVPQEWLLISRPLTFALYAMCTLTLYQALLADELKHSRYRRGLRLLHWLSLPLLAGALLLPYRLFLPPMWVIVLAGLSFTMIVLFSVMLRSRTRVAYWIAASFGVTFAAAIAEIVAAAFGHREVLGVINSVTAALASSVLAALAVAEQMRMERVSRIAAQQELEHTYEAMPVGVFTLDLHGHFLSANPALRKMLGGAALVMGRSKWTQFFSQAVWSELHDMLHNHREVELEIHNRDSSRRYLVHATVARGRIEGVLQDITEQAKATEQLRFMANNDPLTKVFNRRGIEKMFAGAIGTVANGKPLALAYLDLDRFKLINDLFGHTAGDEVLRQVCERMQTMLAGGQQIGRVGGDEFVIIMPDTSMALASLICRGIIDRIGNTPYRVGDKAFHVRCSIGLIDVNAGMQMKDAVSSADRACREAKTGRKSSLVVYERNASAFHEHEAELSMVAHLSSSNATEGMFLEMQPIMSLTAPHGSLNFEVLLRMRERDGSVTSAGPIIAAAEKSGRAGVVDRWVLASTLAWIQANLPQLPNTQFVCMNLSGASLNDERFVQDTIDILRRHAHVAGKLCMEITESVALHDLDNTRRFIDQVRNFGVKVALDDFGAGYTSFSYLKELPADVLKIDGNFIVNINDHPADVAIVAAIVNLALNLGMKTIAEWAEDTATVRTLAAIGVDYVQGFAVARSQSPDKILAAASAASFIEDEELALLARMLGAPAGLAAVPGPAATSRRPDLH